MSDSVFFLPREIIVAAYCKVYGYNGKDVAGTAEEFADRKIREVVAEHSKAVVLKAIREK